MRPFGAIMRIRPSAARRLRIVLGLCLDGLLFGALLPWLCLAAGRWADGLAGEPLSLGHPAFPVLGGALLAVGGGWLGWAWALLVRQGNGHLTELFGMEISPVTDRLVTSGPFASGRHPICLGYAVIISGLGMVIGSPTAAFFLPPLLLAGAAWYVRRFEEPGLAARFGGAYARYRQRVPLFIAWKRAP